MKHIWNAIKSIFVNDAHNIISERGKEILAEQQNQREMKKELLRQTGRTTRIVQHVVEQLYGVGTCIATDHIVYEFTPEIKMLKHFKEMVEREVQFRSYGSKTVKTSHMNIEGIPYVKFELITNEK